MENNRSPPVQRHREARSDLPGSLPADGDISSQLIIDNMYFTIQNVRPKMRMCSVNTLTETGIFSFLVKDFKKVFILASSQSRLMATIAEVIITELIQIHSVAKIMNLQNSQAIQQVEGIAEPCRLAMNCVIETLNYQLSTIN